MKYFDRNFYELMETIGWEKAQEWVVAYQKMSEEFKDNPSFMVHNCELLKSYKAYQAKFQRLKAAS
jgi:hypothetical protein